MADFAANDFVTDYGADNGAPDPVPGNDSVGSSGGGSITYRMKGFDTHGSVNDWVYWTAIEIDSDASEYSGSAGPVTRISLVKEIGI